MTVALDAPVQEARNQPSSSRAAGLMMVGFLIYTLLILVGHLIGFAPGYAYLHKVLIASWSIFIPVVILSNLVLAITPADSLVLAFVSFVGFFGCGINITGFLMAVVYANAFDIDLFIRRTLVYTLLTAILVLVYAGLVFGSQATLATFSVQVAGSQVVLVGSTLVIAALF